MAVGVALARLHDEVAVLEHPGDLEDRAELGLAPAAAYVRRAQRGDEVAGLRPELVLPGGDRGQLLCERAAHVLELLRLPVDPGERLLERRQLALRELEEGRVVLLEGLGAERGEVRLQVVLRLLEQRALLLGRRALARDRLAQGVHARAQREPSCHGAEDDSEQDEESGH